MKKSATDSQNPTAKNKNILLMTLVMWVVESLYLASPIDLVPDLIPVLGQVDDVISLLLVIGLTFLAIQRMRRKPSSDQEGGAPNTPLAQATVIDTSIVEEPLIVSPTLED